MYLARAFRGTQGTFDSAPLNVFKTLVDFLLRPLGKELYAGAIDACGGKVLANILPLVGKHHFFH